MPKIGRIYPTPDGKKMGRIRVWNKQFVVFQMIDHPKKGTGNRVPPFQIIDNDGHEYGTAKFHILPNTGEECLKINMDDMDWPETLWLTGYKGDNDSWDLDWSRPRKKRNNDSGNTNQGQAQNTASGTGQGQNFGNDGNWTQDGPPAEDYQ